MKLPKTLVAVCCILALLPACKKTDAPKTDDHKCPGSSATKQALLDGKWQQSASVVINIYNGKDTTITDRYAKEDECEKDDFHTYSCNGTLTYDEGANICPHGLQTYSCAWALLNNDTRLFVDDDNPDTMDLEISSTEMKLTIKKPVSPTGTTAIQTDTYKNIR